MTAEHLPAVTEHGAPLPVPTGDERTSNPYWVYLDSLKSAHSKRNMRGCLDRLARIAAGRDPDDEQAGVSGADLRWGLIDYEQAMNLRSRIADLGWSATYINVHLSALRQVLKMAWRLGQMPADRYERARDIANVKASRLPAGHHVPDEAVAKALDVCVGDPSPAGRRDAALLAVLYSTGCRRAEIAAVMLADYNGADRSLRIIGKGDKEREVYLTSEAVSLLEEWLNVRGMTAGALFCPIFKGGRLRLAAGKPAPMSGQAIADILTRRLAQAGAARRTPHDMRRTFIGNLLDAGVDLVTAKELAGHSSPVTTAAYDRRPGRRRREAVDKLMVPVPGRSRPGSAG